MFAVILLSAAFESSAARWQKDSLATDTVRTKGSRQATRRMSMRFNSVGFFNFSGRICSNTPAADLNLSYEKHGYGASLFMAKDLTDNHNENNFAFAIVYKRIPISPRFSFATHVGVVMDHFTEAFGDRVFFVSSFKASPRLTIDETSLIANIIHQKAPKEWVNRVRFIYSHTSHIQFVVSSWHNNAVFDETEYVSGAFQAAYNRIELSKNIYLNTAASFFVMAASKDEVSYREKNGLLLTVGVSLE